MEMRIHREERIKQLMDSGSSSGSISVRSDGGLVVLAQVFLEWKNIF